MKRMLKGLFGAMALSLALFAGSAQAAGWAPVDAFQTGEDFLAVPVGVTVDQASGNVYTTEAPSFSIAGIRKFDPEGVPLSQFGNGEGGANFVGVAVNPVNQNIYGLSNFGDLFRFTSAGTPIGEPTQIGPVPPEPIGAQISSDGAGNIYIPEVIGNVVKKLDPEANPLLTITGSETHQLTEPRAVAVASNGDVLIADSAEEGRVQKFDSAGTYVSTLTSGAGSVAVAVDNSSGNVFVLNLGEAGYHVVVYDSAGDEVDDFGLGTIKESFGINQLAVNETTETVYVTSSGEKLVWIFEPVAAPTATTGTAGAITQTTATLAGTVNPNGSAVTDCHFEYGTTTTYGSSAPCVPASPGEGETAVAVTAKVSGLSAKTGYHFKLVTENGGGEGAGLDAEFTTLVNAPSVSTTSPSGITQTTATIAGTVNPNGSASSCSFEYGTSASYGTKVPCPTDPGSGSSAIAESLGLSGLSAGTTYHYRLSATNSGGTANGADVTFTTQTVPVIPPVTPVTPSVTPPPVLPPPTKPLKCKKGFKKKTVKGKAKCVKVKKKRKKSKK